MRPTPYSIYLSITRHASALRGDNETSEATTARERTRCCSEPTGLTDGMGLRPTQPIGTKDAKQTAEIYARISQETFDQVRRGRR